MAEASDPDDDDDIIATFLSGCGAAASADGLPAQTGDDALVLAKIRGSWDCGSQKEREALFHEYGRAAAVRMEVWTQDVDWSKMVWESTIIGLPAVFSVTLAHPFPSASAGWPAPKVRWGGRSAEYSTMGDLFGIEMSEEEAAASRAQQERENQECADVAAAAAEVEEKKREDEAAAAKANGFCIGDRVKMTGSHEHESKNGEPAEVLGYDIDTGLYEIRCDVERYLVKPENLEHRASRWMHCTGFDEDNMEEYDYWYNPENGKTSSTKPEEA